MIADLEVLLAAKWFSVLDAAFARAVTRLAGDADPLVALGAAEASRALTAGHVCVDIAAIGGAPVPVEGEGDAPRWPAAERWRTALASSAAVGDGSAATPLVRDRAGRLYLYRYWLHERDLARDLLARAAATPDGRPVGAADLERLFPAASDPAIDPDGAGVAGQRAAAGAAAGGMFTAISGGPGTGKTWAVAGCLALLAERTLAAGAEPPRVCLLAPTGKAASRLADSIRAAVASGGIDTSEAVLAALPRQASTIHRALGFNPRTGRFLRDADSPLAADAVVVDEASMIDLALLAALVSAVPARARLIMLGDRDQLASVEAGSVFGDICAGPAGNTSSGLAARVAHLSHSFRYGAGIRELAEAINRGDADAALAVLDDPARPEVSLARVGDTAELATRVLEIAAEGFATLLEDAEPAARLAALDRFRVLTAHRRGADGGELLGRLLESALAPAGAGRTWYPGRPVMVTRSDHDLRLYNGDTGVAVEGDGRGPLICFPGSPDPRLLPAARLPAHETAFAVTVHKAQGSEFDEVLVVLPLGTSPVLTRELFYTAVTRARSKVVICASRESVRRAVNTPIRRSSGLRDALWDTGQGVTISTIPSSRLGRI